MKKFIRGLVMCQFITYYCAATYHSVKSCIVGNWFTVDLKVEILLVVANTFLIIYLLLKK